MADEANKNISANNIQMIILELFWVIDFNSM